MNARDDAPRPAGRAFRAALGLLLAVAVFGGGCASKLPRAPQTFTLDPPTPRAVPPPGATRVLALRPAEVAPAYAGVEFVYRVGEHAIERDPYASFAAPPAWLLTSAVRGYLRDADYVRDVVVPGEGVPVDAEIEPALTEICADFTNTSEPAAVVVVHFRVLAPGSAASPRQEILLKTYTGKRPISERTAASVVAGWNQALAEIMAQFLADLKSALPPAR